MTDAVTLDLGHEEGVGFYHKRERRKCLPHRSTALTKGRRDNSHILFGVTQWIVLGEEKHKVREQQEKRLNSR